MRIFRMACFLVLGALLCLLLIYALGWRPQKPPVIPAVILVGAKNSNMVHPGLQIGQVLTWERSSDAPFTIGWIGGEGPCTALVIPSSKSTSGGWTATCTVVKVPAANVTYTYGIVEGTHSTLSNQNLTPCWGCTYISGNNQNGMAESSPSGAVGNSPSVAAGSNPSAMAGAKAMTDVGTSPITVYCSSDANSGSVSFIPASDPIPGNLLLEWSQVPNVTINPPIVFTDSKSKPANVTCLQANPLSCNFSSAINYPITYTMSVTGTTNSQSPAYCGPSNVTGSGTGTVISP